MSVIRKELNLSILNEEHPSPYRLQNYKKDSNRQ